MSNTPMRWHKRALQNRREAAHIRGERFSLQRVTMTAQTFREDPLPDRIMTDRGVSLAKVKWLERPDP